MAIELTGTPEVILPTYYGDDATGSQSITVPADCEIIIAAYIASWSSSTEWVPSNIFDLGGSDFVQAVEITEPPAANDQVVVIEHFVNPSTGSQTLNWNSGVHAYHGTIIIVAYYKGVDTTTPIVDTAAATGNDLSGMTFNSGDMMVGCLYSWNSDPTMTASSQTQVAKSKAASTKLNWGGMAQKLSTGSFDTTSGGSSIPAAAAIILAQASTSVTYEEESADTLGFSETIGGEQIVTREEVESTFGINVQSYAFIYQIGSDSEIGFGDSIDGELVSVICESASSFGLSELVGGTQVVVKKECLSVVGLNEFTNGVIAKYKASGTVTELGSPVSRKVRLYRSSNGMFVDEAMSSSVDGTYDLFTPYNEEHYIVCLDDEDGVVYNPLANIAVLEGY